MQDKAAIELILASMREGLSLRQSCAKHGVNKSNFLFWVENDPLLADQYARARYEMLDYHAEELEAIGEQAARAQTAVEVNGLRLKSDNRKWLLSKLAPKRYGDRIELAGGLDIKKTASDMTDDELRLIAGRAQKPQE